MTNQDHNTSESNKPIRVAIVGAGVSGLSAAWHLLSHPQQKYNVTVFESEDRLGGHAYTIPVPVPVNNVKDGASVEKLSKTVDIDVDVGFMVYNPDNYPNMTKWFSELGVEPEKSDMALSVSLDHGKSVEWSSDGISGLFANKQQIISPSFYSFILDMLRFNKEAEMILTLHQQDPRRFVTVGEYLRLHQYSESFGKNYLLPMMAALWSASMTDVLNFPMEQLVGFMCNHKMLRVFDRPLWNTVKGRSRTYTDKMMEFLQKYNAMKLSTPIQKATKLDENICQYELFTNNDKSVGIFEHIIFACHPPTAGKILSQNQNTISSRLLSLLQSIEFADNVIYLHSDPKLMPKRKAAWASWNCLGNSALITTTYTPSTSTDDPFQTQEQSGNRMKAVYVTYYLNRLQNLKTSTDIFVSLNPHSPPDPDKTYKKFVLAHPQFTPKTTDARQILEKEFQGKDNLWFAGAWSGYGFHEDGCRSGFHVSTQLSKVPLPWVKTDGQMLLPPPDLTPSKEKLRKPNRNIPYTFLVKYCKWAVSCYLKKIIKRGSLRIVLDDDTELGTYGKGGSFLPEMNQYMNGGGDKILLQVFDEHFFVDFAMYGDEGIARSYSAGHILINTVEKISKGSASIESPILGESSESLLQFLLLLNANRDDCFNAYHCITTSSFSFSNILAKIPAIFTIGPRMIDSILQYWTDKFIYLSNPLYYDSAKKTARNLVQKLSYNSLTSDKPIFQLEMFSSTSSGIFDAVATSPTKLCFNPECTLKEAHVRKVNALLDRLNITHPNMNLLLIDTSTTYGVSSIEDDTFGSKWGMFSAYVAIEAVRKYKCNVQAITASMSECHSAMKFLNGKEKEIKGSINFMLIPNMMENDCRSLHLFSKHCKKNQMGFDRVLVSDTCTLIEKAASLQESRPFKRTLNHHSFTSRFFSCIEILLKRAGIFTMETTIINEKKKRYRYSNALPSLHELLEAMYHGSTLTLEHIDNIGPHHSKTLKSWRRGLNLSQFNSSSAASCGVDKVNPNEGEHESESPNLDNVVWRAWNYYGSYCEAALRMRKFNTVFLTLARPGCKDLVDFNQSNVIMQSSALSEEEVSAWLKEA